MIIWCAATDERAAKRGLREARETLELLERFRSGGRCRAGRAGTHFKDAETGHLIVWHESTGVLEHGYMVRQAGAGVLYGVVRSRTTNIQTMFGAMHTCRKRPSLYRGNKRIGSLLLDLACQALRTGFARTWKCLGERQAQIAWRALRGGGGTELN